MKQWVNNRLRELKLGVLYALFFSVTAVSFYIYHNWEGLTAAYRIVQALEPGQVIEVNKDEHYLEYLSVALDAIEGARLERQALAETVKVKGRKG